MTQAAATPAQRRWTPRLRFSLRVLLLAITAFAIGFPIWYRWPYEEVELHFYTNAVKVAGKWEEVEDRSKPPQGKTTKTLRRTWGSLIPELIRVEVDDFPARHTKIITHHQGGQLHGLYQYYEGKQLIREGKYERGEREGAWVHRRPNGTYTAHWHQGRLDGLYEAKTKSAQEQILFASGRIVHQNGSAVENSLFDRLESGEIDLNFMADNLRRPEDAEIELHQTPLKDAVQFLQDAHGIPIELDERQVPDVMAPITAAYEGLDLCSTLTLIFAPHGLACDYRHGFLWVTTTESAHNWRDTTGVAQLQPPDGSALGAEWNRVFPFDVDAADVPLCDVLNSVAKQQHFEAELDTSRIAKPTDGQPAIKVTAGIRGQPLRHVLGILLYKTNCRCKWEQGKLVILPPEAAKH